MILGLPEAVFSSKKTCSGNLEIILRRPGTVLKPLRDVLDGLKLPWRAAEALRKPLGRILGRFLGVGRGSINGWTFYQSWDEDGLDDKQLEKSKGCLCSVWHSSMFEYYLI